jgi:hypothetical protein
LYFAPKGQKRTEVENPYQAPQPTKDFTDAGAPAVAMQPGMRVRGLVGHVRVLAILIIVQGVLSLLMGLMLVTMAIFMGAMFTFEPPPEAKDGPSGLFLGMIMGGTYLTMGLCGAIPGALQIYAGLKLYQFKSRSLGIIALSSGLATILTCYCAPTSIALFVYGLIVLLNDSVREAFELAKQGHSPDQIDLMFNPLFIQQQQQLKPSL